MKLLLQLRFIRITLSQSWSNSFITSIVTPSGGEQAEDDVCGTTEWSPWSECSVMCGEGVIMRNRFFLNRMGFKKCPHVNLVEKDTCQGIKGTCIDAPQDVVEGCHVTMWSEWSPCTASCGDGRRGRSRFFLGPGSAPPRRCQLEQWSPCMLRDCHISAATAKEICALKVETGLCRGYFPRYFFNVTSGKCESFVYGGCRGNENNFDSPERCQEVCGPVEVMLRGLSAASSSPKQNELASGPPLDCMVSPWGEWTPCTAPCGNGTKERYRMIKLEAQNGGKTCPKKLTRRKKCNTHPCP